MPQSSALMHWSRSVTMRTRLRPESPRSWRTARPSSSRQANGHHYAAGAPVIAIESVTLTRHDISLEPLTTAHEQGLSAAAADGELWQLWFTAVPTPDETRQYIADALAGQ